MPGKPTYGDLQRKVAELEARLRLVDLAGRKRAEDPVHEERQRLETVLEGITDGWLVLDGDWRCTYVSETCARMPGMRREDLIGGCVWDLFPHAKGTKFYEGYHRAVATRQPVHFEEFHPQPLNRWLECHCYPGEEGLAVYFRDITERKLAEEAVRRSEERFRIAQELSPDGFTILRPVRDGQRHIIDFEWVYENAAIARLNGTDPNAVAGRRLSEILPGHRHSPFHEIFQRVAETGEAGILEAPYQGDNIPTLTWFRTAVVAMGDDIGVFAQDITVRKQIETTLRESEQRLTALVQNAPVGIVIHGPDGRLARSNPEARRLLGVSETEAIGKELEDPAWKFLREDGSVMPVEEYPAARVLAGQAPLEGLVLGIQRGNPEDLVWALANGLPRMADDGSVAEIIITFTNISDRKLAEEALWEANATLERKVKERTVELVQRADQLRALAGELTISEQRERRRLASFLHDHLQQLLVGAKFRLSVLGRSVENGAKPAAREIEELIDESIKSSRSLTAELSPPILHDAGLNAGLEWLARRMADTQGLFVDLKTEPVGSLPDDLTVLLFESARELLFNIAKHAGTHSACVRLCRIEETLQVIVSDQGVGFDPNSLPPAGEGGRGFGLFSIRERLELFGGKLEIDSAPGRGSRFVISMPITSVGPQSDPFAELPKEVAHRFLHPRLPGKRIRVLLVDDHAVVRQGIQNLLNDEPDIEVVGQAADGHEAVSLASRLLPDVILMDMNMPKLNGVEATRLIHGKYSEIHIIGLSMFEESEKAQAMRDAGAASYLTKSGPAGDLIQAIRRAAAASPKGAPPGGRIVGR